MKVAVVTGAARGIGRAIALSLEAKGYKVVYADVSFEKEDENKSENYILCDISSEADRQRLLDETLKRYGQVDLLVNNAGVAPLVRMDILETSIESFKRVLNINLEGTFFMSQIFARQMLSQGSGRIINIASISSYTSSVVRGEYCISKAGVSMVTQLFADRLAEAGIGVFEIRPGVILTDMTAAVKDKYAALIEDGLTPTRRFGMPQDVANAVLAVADGRFDFSTGQIFNVDGGFHIRRL